jgi:hypothetical protein
MKGSRFIYSRAFYFTLCSLAILILQQIYYQKIIYFLEKQANTKYTSNSSSDTISVRLVKKEVVEKNAYNKGYQTGYHQALQQFSIQEKECPR